MVALCTRLVCSKLREPDSLPLVFLVGTDELHSDSDVDRISICGKKCHFEVIANWLKAATLEVEQSDHQRLNVQFSRVWPEYRLQVPRIIGEIQRAGCGGNEFTNLKENWRFTT